MVDAPTITIEWLPGAVPVPAPSILTKEEAVRYLRLDTLGRANPMNTLQRYINIGLLKTVVIAGVAMVLRSDADEFVKNMRENPR